MGLFGDSKEKQLSEHIDLALADDVLTDQENDQLFEFARSLGLDFNQFLNKHPDVRERVVIASVNAGRFPGAAPPYHILVKPGEQVYIEGYASKLKEVADRQWQGGYSGFSFRVVKGVRYRTGQTRGHMQQVGTKLIVSDAGVLSITSTRIVFSGKTTTREIPYAKLINLNVFAIGPTECLAIAASKGQNIDTETFAIGSPHLFAAVITAASQPHLPESSEAAPALASNVGLISDDGAWRWDGQAWQPVAKSEGSEARQ